MIQGMAAHSIWFEYLLDALGGNIYQSTDRNVYVYRGMECFTIVLFLSDSLEPSLVLGSFQIF